MQKYNYRTIRTFIFTLLFCFLGRGLSVGASLRLISEQEVTVLETASLSITADEDGFSGFEADGIQCIGDAGEPSIPWQIFTVLLPPHADLSTVSLRVDSAEYASIDGFSNVEATPPAACWRNNQQVVAWPAGKTIVDGRDIDIYETNAFWPAEPVKLAGVGKLHNWKLAEIAVALVDYNPVRGSLRQLEDIRVTIGYAQNAAKQKTMQSSPANISHSGRDRVSRLAANFNSAVPAYEAAMTKSIPPLQKTESSISEPQAAPAANAEGYVIITTNSIRNNLTKLNDFVAHKQAMGFTVTVIDEDDTGATATGEPAAIKLRQWLQANYQNTNYGLNGIRFALIIADPRTDLGYAPMKMCIKNPADPDDDGHPTDYFYAELTSNWDADGDGVYGEDGESDKYFEIYTGRIPYYGNVSETDAILQKIIDYENSTDINWRYRAFLPMVPVDTITSNYNFGQQIKTNLLEPRGICSDRHYMNAYSYDVKYSNYEPPVEFPPTDRPAEVWAQNAYGMTIWCTHGYPTSATHVIHTGDVPDLNDGCPAAVWQGSCENGWPENTNNLGYSLLRNGAIGTIAASRSGWYWPGVDDFTYRNCMNGLGYQFAKHLSRGKSIGQSLWETKETLSYWKENYYITNLYGDPSVVVLPSMQEMAVIPTDTYYAAAVTGFDLSTFSRTYTIKNNDSAPLSWTAQKTADWIDLSVVSGTLSPGGSVNVAVSLNSQANILEVGTYTDTIIFTDATNGIIAERPVEIVVQARKMIANLKLDENTAATAHDSTVNGHDGELAGGFDFDTSSVAGKFHGALHFDGVDDYIDVNINLLETSYAVALWFKTVSSNVGILSVDDGSNDRHLYLSNGNLKARVWNNETIATSGQNLADGQWHHVVHTFGATVGGQKLYVDGVLKAQGSKNSSDYDWQTKVKIGYSADAASDYFAGAIDDVRIYNYGLSPDEIDMIMTGGWAENPSPADDADDVSFVAPLGWDMGLSAVSSDIYLGVDHNAILNADRLSPEYHGRQQNACYLTKTLLPNTEYFWRIDQVDAKGDIIVGQVWSFTTSSSRTGGILCEIWEDIGDGTAVSDLTGNPDYPDRPDVIEIRPTFEGQVYRANSYGMRFHGFLIPPADGDFTFWITSNDNGQLWLSEDADPNNVTEIASVSGWTGPGETNKYPEQESSAITLIGGKVYYIMALQKEGPGINEPDHLMVFWEGPGIPYRQVIAGDCLRPYASDYPIGPLFSSYPLTAAEALEGYDYPATVAGTAAAIDGGAVTYSIDSGPSWLHISADGTMSGTPGHDNVGNSIVTIKATDSHGRTGEVDLNLSVLDTFTGELGFSDFAAIAARWLDSGCVDTPPCGGADISGDNAVTADDIAALASMWLIQYP